MGSTAGTGLPTFHSWVGGREVEGRAGLRPAVNPATGEAFAQASLLDAAQAGEAVAAAQSAFPAWSRTSFRERTRLLDRLREAIVADADDLARLIEREQGKPFAEALAAEVLPSLDALQHLAAHAEDLLRDDALEGAQLLLAHKEARLVYAPIGRRPRHQALELPLGAVDPGDGVRARGGKHRRAQAGPGHDPGRAADGPPRAEGRVPGRRSERRRLGRRGRGVARRGRAGREDLLHRQHAHRPARSWRRRLSTSLPVELELGGKDAMIVFADATLVRAAAGAAWGALTTTGQSCTSVERVYVQRPVYDAFRDELVRQVEKLVQKVDSDGESDLGAMTTDFQVRIVADQVADAKARGAAVLTGAEWDGQSRLIPPMVIDRVAPDMRIAREETFGPLIPLIPFDTEDEAVRLANDSEYGLTASVWTRGEETARRLSRARRRCRHDQRPRLELLGEPDGSVGWSEVERDRPHPRRGRAARDGPGEVREPRPRPGAGAV